MLKLKLQYFGHLMRRTDSQEKTPRSGEGGDRGWDGWPHWPKEHEQSLGDGGGQGSPVCCMGSVAKSWTRPSDWTRTLLWGVCAHRLRGAAALPRISGPCLGLNDSRQRALLWAASDGPGVFSRWPRSAFSAFASLVSSGGARSYDAASDPRCVQCRLRVQRLGSVLPASWSWHRRQRRKPSSQETSLLELPTTGGCPASPPFRGAHRNRALLPAFFPGSVICPNNSQNSGKHFSCISLMAMTDPTPEQPDGRDARRRVWEGAMWDSCPLSRPATLPAPWWSLDPSVLEPCPLGVSMEDSLCRRDWLIHWPLVVGLSPAPCRPRGEGWVWLPQPPIASLLPLAHPPR